MENSTIYVLIGVAVVIVLAVIIVVATISARRSAARRRELEDRFGPEYHAVVDDLGRRRGHRELERRLEEGDTIDLDRLAPAERSEHSDQWRSLQYEFVEAPGQSVRTAEQLVLEVMQVRGLPVDNADKRISALSVVDPEISVRYREAYGTYRAVEDGEQDVARLRDALIAYRDVFEGLLDRPNREATVVGAPQSPSSG